VHPPAVLRLPTTTLTIPAGAPVLMGIVNASSDSFSDGGRYGTLDAQVERALALVEAGAGIIDVGGESGVTDTAPRSPDEEAALVVPLVSRLVAEGVVVSVDTWKPAVAEAVLDAGASIVNDVTALRGDPEMAALCAERGAGVVLMHMAGDPRTMQVDPRYGDVVAEVRDFLAARLAAAVAAGIDESRIWLDPGIGFGKTDRHNFELLRGLGELTRLGRPILIGTSRKSFIGRADGSRTDDRLGGTIATSLLAATAGASVLRVHDVHEMSQALTVASAVLG
jgi:dihydropteroate synthase